MADRRRIVDACCHITISRFFRDRGVFEVLRGRVLPEIAGKRVRVKGRDGLDLLVEPDAEPTPIAGERHAD